ncbi:MAG: Platelet-activating factor acetylhydrolase [Trebouxia sp. A1-2]|nr:MAG: Platelet-activating factor acetylhydrolase [Trebouxia sp. A1-2]
MTRAAEPFSVGCCDLQWTPDGKVRDEVNLQADQHLAGRLWYPSPVETQSRWFAEYKKCSWLPSYNYAYGFTNFLFLKNRGYLKYTKPAFTSAVYAIGKSQGVPAYLHAPVAECGAEYPLVIFSHGIGGNRIAYSAIICSLVRQGYVVFSVEHADGTASAAQLAYGAGWLYYKGWGSEENRMAQTRFRIGEVLTAYKLLTSMSRGEPVQGLKLSGGLNHSSLLKGKLDVEAVALAGHSYGGATVTALCSQEPAFKCTVALDPWWGALLADQAALEQWKTSSPLLIMGSHRWNIPNSRGQIACGGERQAKLLQAVRYREEGPNGSQGGGAVLLVIKGTAHHTFTDVVPYFHARFGWLTRMLGFTDDIDPALSLKLISQSMLAFLNRHLPLTEAQRTLFKQPQSSSQSTPSGNFTDLAAASHEMADASNQNRKQSLAGDHMVGQTNGMQFGDVNGGAANGLSAGKSLSGRTCEFRVQAEERTVYEEVCKDHIAILELSL